MGSGKDEFLELVGDTLEAVVARISNPSARRRTIAVQIKNESLFKLELEAGDDNIYFLHGRLAEEGPQSIPSFSVNAYGVENYAGVTAPDVEGAIRYKVVTSPNPN